MATAAPESDRIQDFAADTSGDFSVVSNEGQFRQNSGALSNRVNSEALQNMASVFAALSNPGRLATIKNLIEHREVRVQELAERLQMRQPAVSQHLARLKADGLIECTRTGKSVNYTVSDPRVIELIKLFEDWVIEQQPAAKD